MGNLVKRIIRRHNDTNGIKGKAMKIITSALLILLLAGCQTHAIKEQAVISDFSNVQQVTNIPAIDESMATLDMAEFARRH